MSKYELSGSVRSAKRISLSDGKKLASGIIAALMTLSTACGTDGAAVTPASSAEISAETVDPYADFAGIDFGGRDINALIRTQFGYEFNITEESADIVDQAVLNAI